jgi:hypothetical protein
MWARMDDQPLRDCVEHCLRRSVPESPSGCRVGGKLGAMRRNLAGIFRGAYPLIRVARRNTFAG